MSNSLNPDQARHFVGPATGENCLHRLSKDDTRRQRVKSVSAHHFLCPQRNFGRHIVIALSVRPASCPVHISYILWGRNSKFGVWLHLGMAECPVPFSGQCDLDLWLSFYSNKMSVPPSVPLHVRCISPIFFEVGIPNLVCGCILGWRGVAHHFWFAVILTLTSDLVFRIIVSGAYLLYYLR